MNLDAAIKEIVTEKFNIGDYFDSHTVIDELQSKEYREIYMHGFPQNYTIGQYHGMIAQIIRDSGLVEAVKIAGQKILVKTATVFDDLKENHLWKRIEPVQN